MCFKFCPLIKRDFAVVLAAQHDSHDKQRTDELEKQHQLEDGGGNHSSNSSVHKVGCDTVADPPWARPDTCQ